MGHQELSSNRGLFVFWGSFFPESGGPIVYALEDARDL